MAAFHQHTNAVGVAVLEEDVDFNEERCEGVFKHSQKTEATTQYDLWKE